MFRILSVMQRVSFFCTQQFTQRTFGHLAVHAFEGNWVLEESSYHNRGLQCTSSRLCKKKKVFCGEKNAFVAHVVTD